MNGLEFTAEAARQLEAIYQTRDIIAQRAETIRQLALAKGEHVLDVGCGPGYLCSSMGEIVGKYGRVLGIDVSGDLIEFCRRRNVHDWVTFEVADAIKLPCPGNSFDALVCTQVAEYVRDVDAVLSEAFRVLKPNGRAVIVATDWDMAIWHSGDPRRMDRVMRCWRSHCAHPHLPRSLAGRLRASGFRFDGASIFPILNLQWEDGAYSKGMTALIRDFVKSRNEVTAEDLRGWEDEFPLLNETGQYFFSSARFIFRASKRP